MVGFVFVASNSCISNSANEKKATTKNALDDEIETDNLHSEQK
jgi:hypothetical protein